LFGGVIGGKNMAGNLAPLLTVDAHHGMPPATRVISLTFPVVKLFQLNKLLAFHNFLLVKNGQIFKSSFKQIYCLYLKIHVKSFLMTYHMA
jgi:hypothetical protein